MGLCPFVFLAEVVVVHRTIVLTDDHGLDNTDLKWISPACQRDAVKGDKVDQHRDQHRVAVKGSLSKGCCQRVAVKGALSKGRCQG